MSIITEELYNVIEAILITWLFFSYFGVKHEMLPTIAIPVSFVSHFLIANIVTIFNFSWNANFLAYVLVILIFTEIFCEGSFKNHLMLDIIAVIMLALVNLYVFTLIGKLLGVEYVEIARNSNSTRFLAVMLTKLVYFGLIGIVLLIKKKIIFYLHKIDYILVTLTLLVSFILIVLIRNVIYDSHKYYDTFLIILLCLFLLNSGQFITIIYISMKNVSEQNMILMKQQMEIQENSLHILEEKYDETIKIKHDMKNYISCALDLAKEGEISTLINYLQEVSDNKINNITNIVKTKRKVLGAVINSKLKEAQQKQINSNYSIMNEWEEILDVDVGIILANLLDNAIEACERNKNESEIFLEMWQEAGYYCLRLTNTVESDILFENPNLKTIKKDTKLHGVGLRSVKDIVEKYNGIISFNQHSNKFSVNVSLCKNI